MNRKSPIISLLLFTLLVLSSPEYGATQPKCTDLKPQSGEFGYKEREDRCEGMYIANTRSSIRLRSVRTFLLHSDEKPKPGHLYVALPDNRPRGTINLRVNSVEPRVYYSLFYEFINENIFSWPITEIIQPNGIDSSKLVPLSWKNYDSDSDSVFIPVSFSELNSDIKHYGPDTILIAVESTIPIEKASAWLTSDNLEEELDISDRAIIKNNLLYLPVSTSDIRSDVFKLWLLAFLMGDDEPEQRDWSIWMIKTQ